MRGLWDGVRVRPVPIVLLFLAGFLAACDGSAGSTPSTATGSTPAVTLSVGALHLPSVPAGAACPTTPRRSHTGSGEASTVLGEGPVYPVADYFKDGTILELRPDDREPDGNYRKKVRWIGVDYTGPILIRAARIDGPGAASVDFSYRGEQRDGGQYDDLSEPVTDIPATTLIGGPGCYAYQIDGTTFSTTVVFRAA